MGMRLKRQEINAEQQAKPKGCSLINIKVDSRPAMSPLSRGSSSPLAWSPSPSSLRSDRVSGEEDRARQPSKRRAWIPLYLGLHTSGFSDMVTSTHQGKTNTIIWRIKRSHYILVFAQIQTSRSIWIPPFLFLFYVHITYKGSDKKLYTEI